jgi:peptidylglycine monooxygenase
MRMADNGTLWIVDRDAHFVGHFSCDGQLLGGLGTRHSPGNPFQHPTDVALAANGDILVADGYGNSRIHRFNPNGELLDSWGESGSLPGQISAPHAVCATSDNCVMVADRDNDRLQVYDSKGELLAMRGGYCRPTAICPRPDGLFLILDQTPRLSLTDGEGNLKGRCRPVLNGAHGVCVNSRGEVFLAEGNPSRVTRLVPC